MVAPFIRLVVLSVFLLPPVLGAYAVFNLDKFRRGAFGLFAKGAGALMAAIVLGLVYYVLVVILLGRQGTLGAIWSNPLGATAMLFYGQSLAAGATLAALSMGARKFLAIVEP